MIIYAIDMHSDLDYSLFIYLFLQPWRNRVVPSAIDVTAGEEH